MNIEIDEYELKELKYKLREANRRIQELQEDNRKLSDNNQSLSFRIERELEPRIKAEERSYDNYVLTDHAAEASECFADKVDELIDMVKETPDYFVWEDEDGDYVCKILCIIKQELESRDKK